MRKGNPTPKCNSLPGQHNIGRPKSAQTLMVKAMANRDIKELYWAFLTLSVDEIKAHNELRTFSGNHVVAMLEALSKLNAQQPEDNTTMDLASWINKAS